MRPNVKSKFQLLKVINSKASSALRTCEAEDTGLLPSQLPKMQRYKN